MRGHGQFEIMCALAVSGQLREPELRQLKEHAEQCKECEDRILDFASVGAQVLLPQLLRKRSRVRNRIPKGIEDRFAARALAEGIAVRRPAHAKKGPVSLHAIGALSSALLLALLIVRPWAKPARSADPIQNLHASGRPESSAIRAGAVWPLSIRQQPTLKLVSKPAVAKDRKRAAKDMKKRTTMPNYVAEGGTASFSLRSIVSDPHFTIPDSSTLLPALSVRDFAQTNPQNPFSSAVFEIDSSGPPHHVFRYVPDEDQGPKQVSYMPPAIDWHWYWRQRVDPSLGALYTSAR